MSQAFEGIPANSTHKSGSKTFSSLQTPRTWGQPRPLHTLAQLNQSRKRVGPVRGLNVPPVVLPEEMDQKRKILNQ